MATAVVCLVLIALQLVGPCGVAGAALPLVINTWAFRKATETGVLAGEGGWGSAGRWVLVLRNGRWRVWGMLGELVGGWVGSGRVGRRLIKGLRCDTGITPVNHY